MTIFKRHFGLPSQTTLALILVLLLLLLLSLPRFLAGQLDLQLLNALAFVTLLVVGADRLARCRRKRWWGGVIALTALSAVWYVVQQSTIAAWLLILGYELLLLATGTGLWWLNRHASVAASFSRRLKLISRLTLWLITSAIGGGMPLLLMELESRFSDEEFFVVGVTMLFSLLIGTCFTLILTLSARHNEPSVTTNAISPLFLKIRALFLLILLPLSATFAAIGSYQQSFYGTEAQLLPHISEREPFLCATLPQEEAPKQEAPTELLDGKRLFERYVLELERNPNKRTPELGMLALVTDDPSWANAFREALLEDAALARYTEPAHSIKYFQYHAAYRAYYYHHLTQKSPDLFSREEQATIERWFAAINRRTMTVEWVDWLYGFAFNERQVGPYANQEIGHGLISTLVAYDLEEPSLHDANRAYLASGRGGWLWRWRNTDDNYEYQRVWIDNAFFQAATQSEAQTQASYQRRQALSFEWLLLQMLPDGSVPDYNTAHHTYPPSSTMFLGAALTGDERYLWAAAQMQQLILQEDRYIYSQPGLEAAPPLTAQPPKEGSCLLYGNSGLPNQPGILAPDKIIFRDGWQLGTDSHYLLLNLRFTGWHGYKGTNTISVVARDGQTIISDKPNPQPWAWVPAGRQKFRDKRIARSQTNGLLIPLSGISQVVHALTGIGEAWAQDPPFYANVERFTTLPRFDSSQTSLDNWRGWQHNRTIYFIHQGPILVIDRAETNNQTHHAALTWNLEVAPQRRGNELWLGDEMRLVSTTSEAQQIGHRKTQDNGQPSPLAPLPTLGEGEDLAKTHPQSKILMGKPPLRFRESWETRQRQGGEGQSVEFSDILLGEENRRIQIEAKQAGHFDHLTALLPKAWGEGSYEAQAITESEGKVKGFFVYAQAQDEGVWLLHNNLPGEPLTAHDLRSDGQTLLLRQSQTETQLCYIGGTTLTLPIAQAPISLLLVNAPTLDTKQVAQDAWAWHNGLLTLNLHTLPPESCLLVIGDR